MRNISSNTRLLIEILACIAILALIALRADSQSLKENKYASKSSKQLALELQQEQDLFQLAQAITPGTDLHINVFTGKELKAANPVTPVKLSGYPQYTSTRSSYQLVRVITYNSWGNSKARSSIIIR